MERPYILKENNIYILLVLLYTVGLIGHSFKYTFPYMIMLTPFTLVLTGLLVLLSLLNRLTNRKIILWCLGMFIFTFMLEVIGVASGLIFGQYQYGDVLGPKVFGVPFIIGFNWMFIALGAISFSMRTFSKPILIASSAALLSVMFDYLLEPVAVNFKYWQWSTGSVPVQNYLAWGIFVFAAAYSFVKLKLQVPSGTLVVKYFFIQLVFFCMLNIILLWDKGL